MSKFNLKTQLKDYSGKVMTEPTSAGDKVVQEPITMRQVITAAIRREITTEPLTPEDKSRIYELNKKIWKNWSPDLTHADCEFINSRGKKTLDDLMAGRLEDFLEGRDWDLPVPENNEETKLVPTDGAK